MPRIIGNIEQKFPGGFSWFFSLLLLMFFLHGKTQQIFVSRKHKMVNTNRKKERVQEKEEKSYYIFEKVK